MRRTILMYTAVLAVACSSVAWTSSGDDVKAGTAAKPAAAKAVASKEIPITTKSPQALEAFKRGRDLAENIRTAEAAAEYEKAIKADPDFATAHASLGDITTGAPGLKHLEHAAALSAKLPEAERLVIDTMLAERKGDDAKVRSGARKLVLLAPEDWRAHLALGSILSADRKWDEAIAELKKATELSPAAGPAWNQLGYAYLNMGKAADSVAAFRKYAAMMPGEPNPQDSLAEALLAAGNYDEAEAAFRKAGEMNPGFWAAWSGVAQTRFLRGDWTGGREALAKARAAATRPTDQLECDAQLAWSHAAEGKKDVAIQTFESAEKSAAAAKDDVMRTFLPYDRAFLTCASGKHDEALALVRATRAWAAQAGLPGNALNAANREGLTTEMQTLAMLGRADEAKKALGMLEAEVRKTPTQAFAQSALSMGRGLEAYSRGDYKTAAAGFSQCLEDHFECQYWLVQAERKAGDATGADATAARIMAANRRGPMYLYVRSALKEEAPAATAAGSMGTKAK